MEMSTCFVVFVFFFGSFRSATQHAGVDTCHVPCAVRRVSMMKGCSTAVTLTLMADADAEKKNEDKKSEDKKQ